MPGRKQVNNQTHARFPPLSKLQAHRHRRGHVLGRFGAACWVGSRFQRQTHAPSHAQTTTAQKERTNQSSRGPNLRDPLHQSLHGSRGCRIDRINQSKVKSLKNCLQRSRFSLCVTRHGRSFLFPCHSERDPHTSRSLAHLRLTICQQPHPIPNHETDKTTVVTNPAGWRSQSFANPDPRSPTGHHNGSPTAIVEPFDQPAWNRTSTRTGRTSRTSSSERERERDLESEYEYLYNGKDIFKATAEKGEPVTDKVTTHTYEIMYGTHLLPYYHQHPEMKMLEIGLGCDMNYGPGASVWLWRKLFPKAELWEAEYYGGCVEKSKAKGQLDGFQTLVGDQGDPNVLDRWIEESKGNFDVVIDDGGHTQCQIWTSFEKLWPAVKPGGLYFIEDLQVAKRRGYKKSSPTCDGSDLNVPNKLKEILDRLMYERPRSGDVEFLFCQPEACVLKKRPALGTIDSKPQQQQQQQQQQ